MNNIIDSIQLSGTVYALSAQTSGSDTYVSGITVDSGAPTPSVVADGYVKLTWDDDYTQTYTVDYSGSIGDGDTHDYSNVTKIEFGSSSTAISFNFGFNSDSCYHLKTAIFNGDINFNYDFGSAYQLEAVYFFAPNPSGINCNYVGERLLKYVYDGCETYESTEATYPVYVADLAVYSGATLYYDENEQTNVTWGQHFGNRLQQIPSKSLVLTYNDPQKAPISVPISAITEGTGGGNPTVELTQAEYDALVSAGTVSADTYYIITDAQAGDLTNYYTKTETNSAITQATSGKVNTSSVVSSVTSASTDSEIPTAKAVWNVASQGGGGGGKAIEAGRGISITTGETADTLSFDLPISAGTETGSLIIGDNGGGTSTTSVASGVGAVAFAGRRFYGKNYATAESSFAHGSGCSAGTCSHAEGFGTKCMDGFNLHSEGESTEARGHNSHSEGEHTLAGMNSYQYSCHAEGSYTSAMTSYSHAEGYHTKTTNKSEHANGQYNNSVSASTTFGDSGNTLFSVGNGTADSARHNAFEIRQNGDIYISSGSTDIKLQDYLGGASGGITSGEVQSMIDSSISGKADSSSLATVATSGSYNDLTNKPTIPTVTNTITSGSTDVITSGAVYDALGDIETLLSQI